jgi:hypothetical protein
MGAKTIQNNDHPHLEEVELHWKSSGRKKWNTMKGKRGKKRKNKK